MTQSGLRNEFPSFKVSRVEYPAIFDSRTSGHGIGTALHPPPRLVDRSHLPEPETRDEFLGLGKRPVDHGSIAARELHALSLRTGTQALAGKHHARLDEIFVELAHLGQQGLGRHDSRFAVLGRLDQHHDFHFLLLGLLYYLT